MSIKRWTRTRLLPDGGVETAFCCGNSQGHGEVCLTLRPGELGPIFRGHVKGRQDRVLSQDLILPDVEEKWLSGVREGQLAVALFTKAREIRRRHLCSSNT